MVSGGPNALWLIGPLTICNGCCWCCRGLNLTLYLHSNLCEPFPFFSRIASRRLDTFIRSHVMFVLELNYTHRAVCSTSSCSKSTRSSWGYLQVEMCWPLWCRDPVIHNSTGLGGGSVCFVADPAAFRNKRIPGPLKHALLLYISMHPKWPRRDVH